MYHTFHIPKSSGGLRRDDAPPPELMNALRELKTLFDRKSGNGWSLHDIQVLSGLISYYRMVEKDYIDY